SMKMHRAILVVTFLVLMKTAVSDLSVERCRDVFESFVPYLDLVEGAFQQPSPECCRGVSHLNNVVKLTSPVTILSRGNGELVRVCECVEMMGKTTPIAFLPSAINNLPLLCSLSLSFPISVAMDCSQFSNTKDLDAENSN
ncbi:hypothetical protein CARUB_v10007440mg, partial [Capsella rubella]